MVLWFTLSKTQKKRINVKENHEKHENHENHEKHEKQDESGWGWGGAENLVNWPE